MPSKSKKQHDWVPQSVGKEYAQADKLYGKKKDKSK